MPHHPFDPPLGETVLIAVESEALRGNLLGDPARRTVAVHLPEGYASSEEAYPLFVGLAAFTGSGLKQLAWRPFQESLPQRIERLVAEGAMGPVVTALPDGFTSLGGNQYIDSVATGRWESFLIDELLPELRRRFRLRPGREHRALFGKSSGGYGALIHGMRHADRWGAVACHSGDIGFELLYRPEMPRLLDALAPFGNDIERFIEHLRQKERVEGREMHALMMLAMAASYDPDPAAPLGIRLPVDPRTCRLLPERWSAWLRHDPLQSIEDESCRSNLRSLRGLYVDCGSRDEYGLHFGARAFVDRLADAGIEHRYEEFDGTHSGTDHRMDVSLPYLYRAITSRAAR